VADDPTPGELGRLIAGLATKVGELSAAITGLRGELVHREVYAADRRADHERDQRMQADIERIDREADEREQQRKLEREQEIAAREKARAENRRLIWGAVLGCIGAVIATIVATKMLQ
jgi:uncharacterized protein YaiL (DUF2058 family)